MADDYKYHIDHHGSLVRPATLLAARSAGDARALADAETEAVTAVSRAAAAGVVCHGDGQFRREHFESVLTDQIAGFGPVTGSQPLADAAGIPVARRRTAPDTPRAAGRLAQAEVAANSESGTAPPGRPRAPAPNRAGPASSRRRSAGLAGKTTGSISCRITPKAICASSTRLRALSTLTPRSAARPCQASISAVFPIPGGPLMAATELLPDVSPASMAVMRASSASRSSKRSGPTPAMTRS